MNANEALQYLTQICNDYVRTLPPSAAMPTGQVANEAVQTLAQAITPPPVVEAEPPKETGRKLRPVEDMPSGDAG